MPNKHSPANSFFCSSIVIFHLSATYWYRSFAILWHRGSQDINEIKIFYLAELTLTLSPWASRSKEEGEGMHHTGEQHPLMEIDVVKPKELETLEMNQCLWKAASYPTRVISKGYLYCVSSGPIQTHRPPFIKWQLNTLLMETCIKLGPLEGDKPEPSLHPDWVPKKDHVHSQAVHTSRSALWPGNAAFQAQTNRSSVGWGRGE